MTYAPSPVPVQAHYPNVPADLLRAMTTGLQLELSLQASYPSFAVRTGFMVFKDHLTRYCNVNPCDLLVLWISLLDSHELRVLCNHIAAREQYFSNALPIEVAPNALGFWEGSPKDRRYSLTSYSMPPTPRPKCIPLPPEEEVLPTPVSTYESHEPHAHLCALADPDLPSTPRLGLLDSSPNWRARRD
ncbi:hypothetical protein AURDEDRAFT_155491 [Auricularia subglabra TFB-10046 SS5]|nr:hypothetical protein AURDEDRAFT_155491 [Auricularia subglabra TFB-10046 SS5]